MWSSRSHLRVNNKDQCSGTSEDHFIIKRGLEKVDLSRKVPDLEADEGAAGHVLSADLVGALQEQGLAGGHLVENHLLDGRLPAPAETHQQDTRLDLGARKVAEALPCTGEEERQRSQRGNIKESKQMDLGSTFPAVLESSCTEDAAVLFWGSMPCSKTLGNMERAGLWDQSRDQFRLLRSTINREYDLHVTGQKLHLCVIFTKSKITHSKKDECNFTTWTY